MISIFIAMNARLGHWQEIERDFEDFAAKHFSHNDCTIHKNERFMVPRFQEQKGDSNTHAGEDWMNNLMMAGFHGLEWDIRDILSIRGGILGSANAEEIRKKWFFLRWLTTYLIAWEWSKMKKRAWELKNDRDIKWSHMQM